MALSFAQYEKQQDTGLIPKDTILPVAIHLRDGGASFEGMGPSDAGLFKMTNARDAYMIDVEYTVTEGEYKGRKIWEMICAKGNGSDGHNTWESIAGAKIRAILESARQVDPDDLSDDAIAKRSINGYRDLEGMTFTAKVLIEKSKDPQYGDKNKLVPITPDHEDYRAAPALPGVAAAATATAAAPASAKPSW